jgi:hypothetical protein
MNHGEPDFLRNACDATRILSKRRQLFDVKERLAIEKANYEKRCMELEEKERKLEAQAKELLQSETVIKDRKSELTRLTRR